jgi:NAD(P)-dependent dehydrogenase (short-subunit alcohol dehydrogenase family)
MTDTHKEDSRGTLIVTGSGRGIGAAVAKLAGKRGFRVVVNYARNAQAAADVARAIVSGGGSATVIQADISREGEVVRLFESAEREFGAITGLVNNAGITGGFARVESVTSAMLSQVFAVNVIGAMLCAREGVKRMSTKNGGQGGSIVNISSRAAQIGGAGNGFTMRRRGARSIRLRLDSLGKLRLRAFASMRWLRDMCLRNCTRLAAIRKG